MNTPEPPTKERGMGKVPWEITWNGELTQLTLFSPDGDSLGVSLNDEQAALLAAALRGDDD